MREKSRQLLEQTQELSRMATVVTDSNDAITIQDLEGNITAWNAGAIKIYGYSEQEAFKLNVSDLVPEEYKAEALNFIADLKKGELVESLETKRQTKDGKILDIWMVVTKLVDENGKLIGAATTERDITERKQEEEDIRRLNNEMEQRIVQLDAANKNLEAFSYSVSHDLRAPLRGIDGWSLALLEDYGNQLDGQAKTYLEQVRSETQRMGQLIDDLLQLSHLTSTDMSKIKVNLSALAGTIAASLQKAQPDRQVEFVIKPGLNANGDAHLLEIALTNLLDNAFKFTGKTRQARIEFGQTEVEDQRAFYVRDNGVGFDMELAKKLFGAFQRMHRASDFPGTGVGLTTVQRIVHRHGGRIWAEAAVDQGATFYFTLEEIP